MRSNRAGVTIVFQFQVQLVAPQHLTAPRAIGSSRGMPAFATSASFRLPTAIASPRVHEGVGLGCITTATTRINGVRWVVFA